MRQLALLPPATSKVCTGPCRQSKPLGAFSRLVGARDGLQDWCKACFESNWRANHGIRPDAARPRRSPYDNTAKLLADIEGALLADNVPLALMHIADAREDWRL